MTLREKVLKAAATVESLADSYVHCQSQAVQKQIAPLNHSDKVTWFAGHHSGFHAGERAVYARLSPLIEALADITEAADKCADRAWGNQNSGKRATNDMVRMMLEPALTKLEALLKGAEK